MRALAPHFVVACCALSVVCAAPVKFGDGSAGNELFSDFSTPPLSPRDFDTEAVLNILKDPVIIDFLDDSNDFLYNSNFLSVDDYAENDLFVPEGVAVLRSIGRLESEIPAVEVDALERQLQEILDKSGDGSGAAEQRVGYGQETQPAVPFDHEADGQVYAGSKLPRMDQIPCWNEEACYRGEYWPTVPFDGVGQQGHFFGGYDPVDQPASSYQADFSGEVVVDEPGSELANLKIEVEKVCSLRTTSKEASFRDFHIRLESLYDRLSSSMEVAQKRLLMAQEAFRTNPAGNRKMQNQALAEIAAAEEEVFFLEGLEKMMSNSGWQRKTQTGR